jgi:hypothetical protein
MYITAAVVIQKIEAKVVSGGCVFCCCRGERISIRCNVWCVRCMCMCVCCACVCVCCGIIPVVCACLLSSEGVMSARGVVTLVECCLSYARGVDCA